MAGKLLGKSVSTPVTERRMGRKTTKNSEDRSPFPVGGFWEEWNDAWEGEDFDDLLGPDHAARFDAVATAILSGHVEPRFQWTIVGREQIAEVVKPLRVNDPEPVIDQLWQLAGRHLRPVHRKLLGSDLASTARLLKKVTRAAAALEQLLDQAPPVTRQFLEECYVRLSSGYRTGDKLGINALDLSLSNLAHTTYCAAPLLTRERKQPPKILRQMTLKRVVAVVESVTGQRVEHSWKKDDVQKAAFKGTNGRVILEFMQLVEPGAKERPLVEDLIKIRSSRANTPD